MRGLFLPLVLCACVTSTASDPTTISAVELLERADGAFDSRRYTQALESYRLVAAAAKTEQDESLFVQGAAQAAYVFLLIDRAEEGRSWLEAAEGASSPDEPRGRVRVLLVRAAYQNLDEDTAAALETCRQAHALARETGQPVRAVQVAYSATVMSQGEQQLGWCRKAIEDAQGMGDGLLLGAVWRQLGWLLEERGLAQESLAAFMQARTAVRTIESPHEHMVADWSVGHALRLVGRVAEARTLMSEIARRNEQRYRSQRGQNQAEWVGQALRELGELDLAEGNVVGGIQRLTKAREYFVLAGASSLAPDILSDIDQRIEQLRHAMRTPGTVQR